MKLFEDGGKPTDGRKGSGKDKKDEPEEPIGPPPEPGIIYRYSSNIVLFLIVSY